MIVGTNAGLSSLDVIERRGANRHSAPPVCGVHHQYGRSGLV